MTAGAPKAWLEDARAKLSTVTLGAHAEMSAA
jgi:hypothetical protein